MIDIRKNVVDLSESIATAFLAGASCDGLYVVVI